jgi:hyperosmotically inducible protein
MNRLITTVAAIAMVHALPALADKTAGQMVDDSVIQAEAKAGLMSQDLVTGGWDINLETRKGVVQLGGFVDDPEKAKMAAEKVKTVDGVVKVDNQLHQKSGDRSMGQVIDDGVTTSRIKAAIGSADLGQGIKINVDTHNGVVLLTGFVDSAEDKAQAGEIAAKDDNTKRVINGLYVFE